MSNHITASIEFYFKGEKITSSVKIDIDSYMDTTGELPDLYPLLAQAINLGFYSYEYEMMQAETIIFSNAKGLVAEHVNEGFLDIEAFRETWLKNAVIEKLQAITQQHLPDENLQQNQELKNALLAAYKLGKER